jgi:WD40 repeat protein
MLALLILATLTGPVRIEIPSDAGDPTCLAFSPDGRLLACGTAARTNGEALVWDSRDGALVARLTGHEGPVCALVWSPDGTTLCTASDEDKTLLAWDVERSTLRFRLDVPGELRNEVFWDPILQFSRDGTVLLAVFVEKDRPDRRQGIAAWDLETGSPLWIVRNLSVECLAASPDGKALASIGRCRIQIRDIRTGKLKGTVRSLPPFYASHLFFTADGRGLVGVSSGGVQVLDLRTGQRTVDRPWHHGGSSCRFVYSPERNVVLRGGRTGWKPEDPLHFDLLELERGRLVAEADFPGVWSDLALSPTLRRFACCRWPRGRKIIIGNIPWKR